MILVPATVFTCGGDECYCGGDWRGARAAEASGVENRSTGRCPGFKSLSRRHVYDEALPGALVERVPGGEFVRVFVIGGVRA